MSNCESCCCQDNAIDVVIDTAQTVAQSTSVVEQNASPAEETLSSEDVPP